MRSKLREAREAADLNQGDLANLVGVRRSTVSEWETGAIAPSAYYRKRVREALNNQEKDLFALEGEDEGEEQDAHVDSSKERTNMIKARRAVHLTQKEVAKLVKVDVKSVNNWEKAYTDPQLYHIGKLREAINFTGTDEELLRVFTIGEATSEPDHVPCHHDTTRDTVNSTDPPSFIIHIPRSVRGFKEFMDMVRRQFIEALVAVFGAKSFGDVSLAIVSSPAVEPDEYLALVGASIGTWWEWFNQGKFSKVEDVLSANVLILKRLANTFSPFQGIAANLAAQAKFMQMLLATRKHNFVEREIVCAEAVHFGRLSGNSAILALALDWQGNTYTICYHQPQTAIPILHDALTYLGSGASSTRSGIYSNLSIAYAQGRDEGEARKYAELAYMVMPEYPELDPFHHCIRWNHSALNDLVGIAHLHLGEHFPDSDYAQLAYQAFDESVNREAISKSTLGGALTRKGDAARTLGDMNECVKCLTQGLLIAVEFDSLNQVTKVANVMDRVPPEWQKEKAIQSLQKDISHALVVARR